VQSLGGEKYFASFIDDYSRRCWAYPIKKKSDVFEVFKAYKARVELDSRKKIKCLRTDNEERMNRCLLERARAMLATASLGKSFWAEVVNTACYVINRSSSTAIKLKTPKEMWTGNTHELNKTAESQAPTTRTLNPERKRPGWHSDYVMESNMHIVFLQRRESRQLFKKH
nr:Gag-Pol polyprotein [Tanacetum cinerariifolium]